MRPLQLHMVSTTLHVGTVLGRCVHPRGNEENPTPTLTCDSRVSETISCGYSDNLDQQTGEEPRIYSVVLSTMRPSVRRRLLPIQENAPSCSWIGLLTTLSFHLQTYLEPRRSTRAPFKTRTFTVHGSVFMLSMGTGSIVSFLPHPCRPRSYLACRRSTLSLQAHTQAHTIHRGNKSNWRVRLNQLNAIILEWAILGRQ